MSVASGGGAVLVTGATGNVGAAVVERLVLAKLGMASGTTDELERLIGRPPVTLAEWARANAACFAKA